MPKKEKKKKAGAGEGAASGGSGYILLIVFVALLLIVILGGVAYYVLFFLKEDEPAATKTEDGASASGEGLVAAIILFRHGARAPVDVPLNGTTAEQFSKLFPNGAGELTEVGIEDSFKLGQFLAQRYVESKFLRSPPLPSQFYFRSRSNNRCLMSGALVASGMWADPNNPEFTAVPIYGQEKNDRILTHLQNCELETKRLSDKCGKTPPDHREWSKYEGFVFECIGLNKETKLFKDAAHFAEVEGLVQQDRNAMEMPSWFVDNKKEIYDLYQKPDVTGWNPSVFILGDRTRDRRNAIAAQAGYAESQGFLDRGRSYLTGLEIWTYSYIVGATPYHDKEMLRLKQGVLMKTVLNTLKKKWDEWFTTKAIAKRKFIVYSTQDWLLLAFLDALGCAKAALAGIIPNYNTLVVIELVARNGKPFVQVHFKDNTLDSLKDVTESVRGCGSTPCPLDQFLSCCNDYVIEDPKTICGTQS